MKNILIVLGCVMMMYSCESFLDVENLEKKTSENFPQNEEEVQDMVTGLYSVWTHFRVGTPPPMGFLNAMSDEMLGGGDNGSNHVQAMSMLRCVSLNYLEDIWKIYYRGVARANKLIDQINTLDKIVYSSPAAKNTYLADGYFHRAAFYLDMVRLWERVPLVLSAEDALNPQADPDQIFGQICADLKKAIELYPNTKWTDLTKEQRSHVTKWAAEGLMARAFLYYTGFYNKTEVALPDGGKITKQDVITWLDDCITNSGHDLEPKFGNLWAYSFDHTKTNYKYAIDNNLKYVGDDNSCSELVWAIKYSTRGVSLADASTNPLNQYFGLRDQAQAGILRQNGTSFGANNFRLCFPYAQGWAYGPVNTNVYQKWLTEEPGDIRRDGSILQAENPAVEGNIRVVYKSGEVAAGTTPGGTAIQSFNAGTLNWHNQTGYWNKKHNGINVWQNNTPDGTVNVFSTVMHPGTAHDWRWKNSCDLHMMRFSDILLMAAELGCPHAQAHFDRVRTRAGLVSKQPTLENIQKERQWELMFEGVRYWDMMRWGISKQVFDAIFVDLPVWNSGTAAIYGKKDEPMRDKAYIFGADNIGKRFEATRGFLAIPQNQIELSNGLYQQNPGWLPGDDYAYQNAM